MNWCCCNSLSNRLSSCAKPGRRALPPEQFQFILVPQQQRAQNHDAAFVGKNFGGATFKFFENELREPLEGKNVQPREAVKRRRPRATGVRAGTWPVWARAG